MGMDETISASAAAFDAIAPRYDDMFSAAANPLIAMMRARVFRAVDRHFAAPAQLPEIGCGTPAHAPSLAGGWGWGAGPAKPAWWRGERAHRVGAGERAPAMIATARAKLAAAGRTDAV